MARCGYQDSELGITKVSGFCEDGSISMLIFMLPLTVHNR